MPSPPTHGALPQNASGVAPRRLWRPNRPGRRCAAQPRTHHPRLQRRCALHRRAAARPPFDSPIALAPAVIWNFGAPRGGWQPCRRPQAATTNTAFASPAGAATLRCTTRAPRACDTPGRAQTRRRGAERGTALPRRTTTAAAPCATVAAAPKVRAQPRVTVPRRRAAPRAALALGTYTGCGGAIRVARRWWCAPTAARAPPHLFRQMQKRDKWGALGRWSGPCTSAAARNRRRAVPLIRTPAVANSRALWRRCGSSGSRRDLATIHSACAMCDVRCAMCACTVLLNRSHRRTLSSRSLTLVK